MKVFEFEKRVADLEGVDIVLRAPIGDEVGDYPFTRKVHGSMSVVDWLEGRVKTYVGDVEVQVLGKGNSVHPRTKMETLRNCI